MRRAYEAALAAVVGPMAALGDVMTPTPCPKCGTMLDATENGGPSCWEPGEKCLHTIERCRDVLRAQMYQERRENAEQCAALETQLTAERTKVEEARKALETTSQFCKDGHDDGFPSECHCGWCETRTVVDAALEKLRGQ